MSTCTHRILVIEDDRQTAAELDTCLGGAGYDVTVAADGRNALSFGLAANYAVMTIDRMLPDVDGIEVIRRLREDGVTTPALMISVLGGVADLVEGLQAGADDYLVKPFATAEMLARVNALCRRSVHARNGTTLRTGDLTMDLVTRTIWRGERQVELRPQEFRLLEYLVRHAGEVVSRDQLMEHVWGLKFASTNLLDVYIGRLRKKVDSQYASPIIHTIRRAGFCVRSLS